MTRRLGTILSFLFSCLPFTMACSSGAEVYEHASSTNNTLMSGRTSDAGAPPLCAPTDPHGAPINAMWRAPTSLHRGLCTAAQTQLLIHCLYDTGASTARECIDFQNSPQHDACRTCGVTPMNVPVWGAIYHDVALGMDHVPNVEACVGLLSGDPSERGCGAKLFKAALCDGYVCASCRSSEDSLESCMDAAEQSYCAPLAKDAACAEPLIEQCSPAAMTNQRDVATRLVRLFCER